MNSIITCRGAGGLPVALRLGKIRGGFAENLIGLLQLAVLTLQGLDPLAFSSGRAFPTSRITFGLTDPATQRLRCSADLGGNGADSRPLRGVVGLVVEDHADGPLTDLRGISLGSVHGSILSRFGASGNPGTVQCSVPTK